MNALTPRQTSILNRVVDTYIETAQPVGSRHITHLYSKLYRGSYCSATVRHEMVVLEDRGYLTHPHTSAGRIPTDSGYRFYIDHGLQTERLGRNLFEGIARELTDERETDWILDRACDFISAEADEICLIMVRRPKPWTKPSRCRLYLHGASRLLRKPEFRDVRKAQTMLAVLEEKTDLVEWLIEELPKKGIAIAIGRENRMKGLEDCTLVFAPFQGAKRSGAVCVIGPRRMRYARTLPLVRETASYLENVMGRAL